MVLDYTMSFDVQEFVSNLRLATLAALKKSKLLFLANHNKVATQKADLQIAILQYLMDEKIEGCKPTSKIE